MKEKNENSGLITTYTNNIKGAIAETLIKELFLENEYVVFDYGVEHIVPGFNSRIKALRLNNKCANSKVIKQLPDLLISKNGKADYIEVKFRSHLEKVEISENYPFKQAYFIYVTKDGIFIGKASDLIKNKKLKNIIESNTFNLSKKSIDAAVEAVRPIFKAFSDNQHLN